MKCNCGGTFKEKIQGMQSPVMVCDSCGEIVFNLKQSKSFHKLKPIPVEKKAREGWNEAFKQMKKNQDDKLIINDNIDQWPD